MIKHDHTIQTKNSGINLSALRVICLALVSILLTGGVCEMVPRSEPVFRKDLIGDYVANFDKGLIDSLRLNEDSTYIRWFMGEDSVLFVDTGFWRMQFFGDSSEARDVDVLLPSFITRYDISIREQTVFSQLPGSTNASVPSWIGLGVLKDNRSMQVHIQLGQRFGMAYIKVKRKRE